MEGLRFGVWWLGFVLRPAAPSPLSARPSSRCWGYGGGGGGFGFGGLGSLGGLGGFGVWGVWGLRGLGFGFDF